MNRQLVGVALAIAGAGIYGCGDDPASNGTCTRDFDCPVGKKCTGASADAEGTCADAKAGDERDFGEVTMSFSGSETYLLGLFALPTIEAAPDELVSFSLSAGGGAGGALRAAPAPRTEVPLDHDFWAARIRIEGERRAGVDRLVNDLHAGRRAIRTGVTKQTGNCAACAASTTEMCWQDACTNSPTVKSLVDGSDLACTLAGVVSSGNVTINVLIDDDDNSAPARSAATTAATAFAQAVGRSLDVLGQSGGHSGSLDRDGDGRMTVVFTEKLTTIDASFVGGFSYKDFLPAADQEASGNESDLMWARVPTNQTMASCPPTGCTSITQEVAIGTLVHEYTHLVNFAVRVYAKGVAAEDNEVLWLDEAMAHLLEDVVGYGASNIGAAAYALDQWPSATFAGPNDSVEQRGMAYTLLRHLVDRGGAAAGSTTAAAANTAYKLHGMLANESARGFLHSAFQTAGADGIWQWLLATYATNNNEVTEASANGHNYLTLGTVSATGQTTGFDPFGTFTDARGVSITLQGPGLGDGSTDELSDFATPFSSEVAASGAIYYLVTGLDGETILTGRGDAFTNLQLRAQRVQ